MIRWTRPLLGVLLAVAAFGAHAQACTTTISPGQDITGTVAGMAAGQVLCLNVGTYAPPSPGFPGNGSFAIGNGVIVRGLGAGPANVVLQATNAADHAVYFTNYLNNGKVASGGQLINLTIAGSPGGVQVQNFTNLPAGRLVDIKLKNVVISTTNLNVPVFGVKLQNADRIVLDNVTLSSRNTALLFIDTNDSVVMNSTVPNTIAEAAAALAVWGGSGNRFVRNTFGTPRATALAGYSFNGGGVVFYNTSDNRFENNVLQGVRDDALDYTIVDLSSVGVPLQKSLNNYVGKNQIIHTAFALNGSVLGSAGIWSNCASDGTWIYGNDVQGAAECGICSWGSNSNMILGNTNFNNGITGIFASSGNEVLQFCAPAGNTTFRQKQTSTFIQSNANFFNKNDQLVTRNVNTTVISRNFSSPKNQLNGTPQGCTNAECQAAYSIETDGSMFDGSSGTSILANTSVDNLRGLWADYANVTGIEFYLNRTINSTHSRWVTGSTQNIDRGSFLGGNYWTQFIPTAGNPSSGQPYTGVFHNSSNQTGNVVDRFPYRSENLGRGYGITVFEPRAASSVSRGSRRTVRWDSLGCVYVDVAVGATPVLTNVPNTGYAIVTIPAGAALGNTSAVVTCKDSAGVARGSANSPTFAITAATLQLVSPGRDDTFNASQQVWVGWRNTDMATNSSVNIDYSPDGGATWPTTLATINQATDPRTSTRVALPAAGSAYAMLRVRSSASVVDQTDGVFSLRGATGTFANVSAGRTFRMGQMERLEWSSPTNSRLVTITAAVGATIRTVATNLPDRGSYDWVMPDLGAGTLVLTINYATITGAAIGAPVIVVNAGATRYPTTITFGTPPAIGPGQSGPLAVTTNSGAPALIGSTTPAVCTVTGGNTINGIANGTCSISASAPASGNFAAAPTSVLQFTIGQAQTITFAQPQGYIGVGSSIALVASASSGGPITFTSNTPGVCTISGGNVLAANTVGTCTVTASQPGFGGFGAAAPVQRSLQAVAPANIPRLANISTRMQVLTGADVLIGGFVIGSGPPKTVVVRARGPSLTAAGVPGALANPALELYSGPTVIAANDNWQQAANQATLLASGYAPSEPLEAAIYTTLGPGPYTAIVTGAGGSTGVGIIEVFEVDHPEVPLVNIATRGQVLTGADVMIAGFIIQGQAAQTVVVRARGPSLTAAGVPGALGNPRLQLFQGGTELANNDNWQTAANQAQVQALGFAPSDPNESAILTTLPPGAYTAIVTGVSNTTGVGIVEVFGVP